MSVKNQLRRTILRTGLRLCRPGQPGYQALEAATHRTDLSRVEEFTVNTAVGPIRLGHPGRWLVATRLYWYGINGYEPETFAVITTLAARSRTFLDVGANIGYYALAAARANRRLRVCAFEPVPQLYTELTANIERNELLNVTAFDTAVGDRCGQAKLFLSDNDCSASILPGFRTAVDQVQVPVTTIDQIALDRGLNQVDLIKIDVEGAEDQVLYGASQVLHEHRPLIICELLQGRNEKAIEQLLRSARYRSGIITDQGVCPQTTIEANSFRFMNHLLWPQERALDRWLPIAPKTATTTR